MKKFFWFPMILLGFATALFAQSENAKKIAESYLNSNHPEYAEDILRSKPDYVVYVPKLNMEVLGDSYNDHFHVIESKKGTLFAFWTQATKPNAVDMHICCARSFDRGSTWTEPVVLSGSENYVIPKLRSTWQQPMISKSGRIYVLWVQQVDNPPAPIGDMFGIYTDDDGEHWSVPQKVDLNHIEDPADTYGLAWCNWQRPLRLGKDGKYLSPSSRSRGRLDYRSWTEFVQYENIDDDPEVKDIKLHWMIQEEKGLYYPGKWGSMCEEASIVKLPDGRLFIIMRTANEHPVWSVSSDDGESWTEPKPLRDRDGGEIYVHPLSPCPIYDRNGPEAASGYYFAFVHNAYDHNADVWSQKRGPLYLLAGKYQPDAEQPIWFAPPQLFIDREDKDSFYSSSMVLDGKTILWYPDKKFYLLGKAIGDEWFKYWDEQEEK